MPATLRNRDVLVVKEEGLSLKLLEVLSDRLDLVTTEAYDF